MKKFSLIIVTLLFIACQKDYTTYTNYVLSNKSTKDVEIQFKNFLYDQSLPPKDTFFIVPLGANFEYSYYMDGKEAIFSYPFGWNTDSVRIIFNNSKEQLYSRSDLSERNPLLFDNYNTQKVNDGDGGVYECIYIIEEEDYENAIPLK